MIFYEQVTCRYFVGDVKDIRQIIEIMNAEYEEKGFLYTSRYFEYLKDYIKPLAVDIPIIKKQIMSDSLFYLLPAKYKGEEDGYIICV